ncbi:MAG: DNA helicase RecG, partial [Deltaproteobacteria bacterium]|nr:DNA helicase RecG [Deltaproteobacteria bacterium]
SDKRLRTLTQLHDGFTLAEEDLKIRGPGETTGFKQSGLPALSWARLPQDLPVLVQARDLALEIIASDPALQTPDFRLVREVIDQMEKRIQGELIKAG